MRLTFDACFGRVADWVRERADRALSVIESIHGRELSFPGRVQCMSPAEVERGRAVGAGHGLLKCRGPDCVVKVNPGLTPGGVLANVIHEQVHFAFPALVEGVVDAVTAVVFASVGGAR